MTDHDFKVGDRVELAEEPGTAGAIKKIFADRNQRDKDVIIVRVADDAGKFELSVLAVNLRPSAKLK